MFDIKYKYNKVLLKAPKQMLLIDECIPVLDAVTVLRKPAEVCRHVDRNP
mgnify:CR=1 FL=1